MNGGALLIGGILLGLLVGYVIGQARARAMRAWRDLMATKKAIKGLWRRVVDEWLTLIKYTVAATLTLVGAFVAGLWAWLS